ncbi:efflux transporter protein [Candidatus Symbiothrix dinenymphae]|nr:efflux transporter protein [Candidatus Symbiothrix dinenymphae]
MEINWKKNTVLFLAGQALSLFGSTVVQYAILWHITLTTQSGTMMTIFAIAGFIPMFLISPFGGVWADRFNRKYIINIADGGIALASLIVAVFLFCGFDNLGILLICAVVRSFGQGVQSPAVSAFIPQIVPEKHLTRINGIQSSIFSCVTLTSPMISGALMAFASLEMMFLLDVVTAAIGIGILFFFVKAPSLAKREQPAGQKGISYFHDLKEGLRYIKKHGYILRLCIFMALFMILAAPSAMLTPLQVTRKFGAEVWHLTAIEITFSIGMLLGGLLIGIWGGFKNRIYTMTFAFLFYGMGVIFLGLVGNFWIYLAIFAVIGITMPLFNTPATVLIQTTVDPGYMGRVFSVIGMISSVMMPLGMLVFGPIADRVSIDIILIGTGIALMLLAIPFVANKTLRAIGISHLK